MAVCQNLVPLVNIKIAGKWMFIPLKMVLIGIDPYQHGEAVPFFFVKSSIQSVLKMDPFPPTVPPSDDLSAQRGHANSKRTWKNGRKVQASKVWIPHDTPKLLYSSAVRA